MSSIKAKEASLIVVTGLLITTIVVSLFLLQPAFLYGLDQKICDVIAASAPDKGTLDSHLIVDIDEKSLDTLGQWPWPRYRIATLLKRIKDYGAKNITVDLLFPESDRTSPVTLRSEVNRDLQLDVEIDGIPTSLEDYDRVLARTISNGPFIFSNKFLFDAEQHNDQICHLHPLEVAWVNDYANKSGAQHFFRASDIVCNIDTISASVSHSGFLNAIPDKDGILRRVPMIIEYKGDLFPSLALSSMMQYLGKRQVLVKIGNGGMESVGLGQNTIPVDTRGNLLIKYRKRATPFDYISAADLLSDLVPKHKVADRFVFVGTSAAGLSDYYQIPSGLRLPGVEIQALTAANVMNGNFLRIPPVVKVWGLIIILFAGIASSVMPSRVGAIKSGIVTAVLICGIWVGSATILKTHGIIFSPLFPILILLLNYSILMSLRHWFRERTAVATTQNTLVQLKESQGQLNSIVKTIPDVVYRLDRSGRITFINDAVEQYGYRPENLVGTEVIDLIAPSDRNGAYYRINERRTGARATNGFELKLLVKDNAIEPKEEGWRHFIIAAEGLYNTDTPQAESFIGTQGIARDINERKQLQQQLLQAQKMEALGTLAGGIAHDFNNLLMGIQGTASLMLLDLDSDHSHYEKIKNIEKHVHSAAGLTKQMLGLARKGQFELIPVDMNQIVKNSSELFGRTKKEIRIHTKLEESIWPVEVDQSQIEQVLLNLYVNAWQAMPGGGDLFLETSNVVLEENHFNPFKEGSGKFIKISVADTGQGMDSITMQRIFDPFFTTKEIGRGTGLGLASAYGIVQTHKGVIDVKSKEGQGTKFDIYLPATQKRIKLKSKLTGDLLIGSETILLIDDEVMILDLAEHLLKVLGYQVMVANGGKAAVAVFKENHHNIDLVILDMIMPDMGGQETCEQLMIINPDVKVLLSSGYSLDGRALKIMQSGCSGFMQKPFGIKELSQKLREILDEE